MSYHGPTGYSGGATNRELANKQIISESLTILTILIIGQPESLTIQFLGSVNLCSRPSHLPFLDILTPLGRSCASSCQSDGSSVFVVKSEGGDRASLGVMEGAALIYLFNVKELAYCDSESCIQTMNKYERCMNDVFNFTSTAASKHHIMSSP